MQLLKISAFVACLAFSTTAHAETPDQRAAEIDALLEAHWKSQGVTRNAPVSDDVFVRRIYLDLVGRIPTGLEATAFLSSSKADKRSDLIDSLLRQEGYVSRYYNFWADILRFKSNFTNTANVVPAAYGQFIKESLRSNKPYDQFVREMLSAKGYAWDNGAIGYYNRDPDMPLDNMSLTSRVFLGTRLECAQCHDHPYDKWKQTDFYHLAAYTYGNKSVNEAFSGARDAIRAREQAILDDYKKEKAASMDGGKAAEKRKKERFEAMEYRKIVGIIKSAVGQLFSPVGLERRPGAVLKLPHDFKETNGKPFEVMQAATLMGEPAPVAPGDDAAEVFARWVTSPKNPRFTRVIVNRLWKSMFGVAVTESFDDLHDDTIAMVPALESHLEKLMVDLHYDMKAFLAVVARTQAYQSLVSQEEYARGSVYHFQGPVLRRMSAEQIWDSVVTLASYEPDARDRQREARDKRRIDVSKMAFEAYTILDGEKLVAMAYARLNAEKELETRERAVREALVIAKRNGDKAKEIELRHQEGALDKERGEALVRDFIMPLLINLARTKAGKDAVPVVDPNYKVNTNPRVLQTETWKRMYVPGYGPPPKSPEQLQADAQSEKQRLLDRATQLGIPETERGAFAADCQRIQLEWMRASELDSPAPRGHFLRTMGQSDRDFVENANPSSSIPQALLLLNGEVVTERVLLSRHSPLMVFVQQAKSTEAQMEAVYLALLSRKPTIAEKTVCKKSTAQSPKPIGDLIYAILNSKQFIFVQ